LLANAGGAPLLVSTTFPMVALAHFRWTVDDMDAMTELIAGV
jgi:hypothetical protein